MDFTSMVRTLPSSALRLVVTGILGAATPLVAEPPVPEDYRFQFEILAGNLRQPMTMQEAPDGTIFFHEIAGTVKAYDPRSRLVSEIGALEVTTSQENGLLGMALDPGFAGNRWIYFLHSPKDFSGQIISRFTLGEDGKLDPASRKDLLQWPEQREQCCHHAGALRFGPDGCLYASTGDNTNPFQDSEGYAPIDERPDRAPWDAQKSSANTNDLRGKILRIRPTADGGYEIPEGNLFPPGTPQTRPEIYAMGFRNPWRFQIDPASGVLFVGDVGPDAGGDREERGPRGFDTVNRIAKPGNYGWPYSRGKRVYVDYDFAAKSPGSLYDAAKPLNRSPNNSGLTELPPVQAPLIHYPSAESAEFPLLGKGGRTACGGPVYHHRSGFEETSGLPSYYDGCLLFYDWQRPFIHWARLDADGGLREILPFTAAARVAQGDDDGSGRFQIKRPVDFLFGRGDGNLYILDYGETWGVNPDARLIRLRYLRGNLPPVTKAAAAPVAGPVPLEIALSAAGSMDHEGDAVTYEWRLGDRVLATTPEAKVRLAEPGDFRIELAVRDARGGTGTASVAVTAGNSPPEVRFLRPEEGDFFVPGEPVDYRLAVNDPEDGDLVARGTEFGLRALVSSAWASGDGKLSDVDPGLSRMKQSDCFNCHAIDQRIIGPTLMEIATKYRGVPGALETSVDRVLKGSTGVWGPLPMLPHGHHSADEIHMMVRWIYSLADGEGTPTVARGFEGRIIPPKDGKLVAGLVEATFSDLGNAPAGPLSGKAVVRLRTRRQEAEQADALEGPRVQGKVIGSIAHGHVARFRSVRISQVGSVRVLACSGGSGGTIEFRAGSPEGALLAAVTVPVTGGWDRYQEFTAPFTGKGEGIPERDDVCLVFVNPGKGNGLMNVDWVEFGQ
jgi:cytochrome c